MGRSRTGKIARLPKDVRDQINMMLRDGVPFERIIKLCAQHECHVNDQNITNWREGITDEHGNQSSGYLDWLKEQERLADMQAKREFAMDIVRQNEGSKLHEASLQLAASQLYEVLSDFNLDALKKLVVEKPENYAAIVNSLAKLSTSALDIEKFKQHVREQKEKIESALKERTADGGISAETLGKIERELKLL